MKYLSFLFAMCSLLSCGTEKGAGGGLYFDPIPTPSKAGGEPNLFVSNTGVVFLSWVEYPNDTTDMLLYSKMGEQGWSQPKEIARGADWFVNWADFPSLVVNGQNDEWLSAHWLQKSAEGSYDYDIRVAESVDGGGQWQPSFIPHRDSIAAEHGFLTMFPVSNDRVFAVWLDGRNTKSDMAPGEKHGHGHGGAMTLRTAEFDREGHLFEEAELDHRICDCCQTDAAMTAEGPVVVYRNRSEEEIRDIGIVRKINGKWTAPHLVHADNWEISGCPVNGPSVAAEGAFLAVAWFTAANGEGAVKVALSNDAGATFSAPIRVDDGDPSGRVDVEILDAENVLVTWLENTESAAEVRAVYVSESGKKGKSQSLVQTSPARSSGFPILSKYGDQFLLAWTQVDSASTAVKTAKLNFGNLGN